MKTSPAEIWLVEDNAVFRRSLVRCLQQMEGLHCARDFGTCEAALAALIHEPAPDVVLIDVGLPGMDGLEGIQRIRAASPRTSVIVLTVFEDDEKIFRAICAGASGYLLKTSTLDEIAAAIRESLAGGSPINSRIARRMLEMFTRLAPVQKDYGLTDREKQILQSLVEGKTKKEIANVLDLSVHTVDSHLRRIYGKLEVNTCTGAVAKALKEGLVL